MEFTNMTLNCYGITPTADTEAFRIEATVTAAGELPTTALFVFSIVRTDTPDADTFARIANPQDLQNLSLDRDAAVAALSTEYLASFSSFQYDDLDQAVAAKATLKTRVNELVNRWIAFQTDFVSDTGVSSSYPSSDPSVEGALITTYTDARDARVAAEAILVDADVTVTISTTALAQSRAYLPTIQSAADELSRINTALYAYWSAVQSEGATAGGLRTTLVGTIVTSAASFSSQVQSQTNTIAAQETALVTAKTEKKEAAATLAAAQAAEDAALVAILAVNPDFDPATV